MLHRYSDTLIHFSGTFRGLNNLETLNLQSNNILYVNWNAFAQLKNLKYLNLGRYFLNKVIVFCEFLIELSDS